MARDIQLAVVAAAAGRGRRRPGRRRGRSHPVRRGPGRGPDLDGARRAGAGHQPGVGRRPASSTIASGARGLDPDHPADLAAEVPAQHAGLPHLDPGRLPGAEQHDHRGRGRVQPGDRRGEPDHRPGPGRRDDHRRGRLEDPPAEPGPHEPARPDVALERASRAGACRPFDLRRDGWVAGRRGGHPDPRGARARPGARGPHLRRDPRLRVGLRRHARRAGSTPRGSAPRSPCGRPCATPGSPPRTIGHVNAHGAGHDRRPTWPRRGPSTASSAPAARSRSRR